MSYNELSISLERMQRFGNPLRKYDRVFREILIKQLIEPKISLKNYYKFSFGQRNSLVQHVWNNSVKLLNGNAKEDYAINLYLLYEHTREFCAENLIKNIIFSESMFGYALPADFSESEYINNSEIIKKIFNENEIDIKFNYLAAEKKMEEIYLSCGMNYPLNFDGFLEIAQTKPNISKNINRLITLNKQLKDMGLSTDSKNLTEKLEKSYEKAQLLRREFSFGKPVKMLILVEGATEELLLPIFSSIAGIDFDKNGIEIISSGGKNQVARIYNEINREISLPIFIILDSDAQEIAEEIKVNLKANDKLYVLSAGEFEDILPDSLICRAVNSFYGLTGKIKREDINNSSRKTSSLTEAWKQNGFGDFKKAEFARIIAEHVKDSNDLSQEMKIIVSAIGDCL